VSNWNDSLNRLSRSVMDFFFPRRCPFCGRPVGKELLCAACERELPFTGEQAVRRGALYGRCASPLYYEGAVRQALLDFKFHGKLGGLNCFGSLMAQCAAEHYSGAFDAVTWVPVSAKRLKKRGFDQARYLAGSLCVDWHVPPEETLRKTADNPPQSGIRDAAARRANVLGMYEPVHPERIAGRRWLLVDDILTTGATLGECARVLREAGAADVLCLTLAAGREKPQARETCHFDE
jgi:ComF family protein